MAEARKQSAQQTSKQRRIEHVERGDPEEPGEQRRPERKQHHDSGRCTRRPASRTEQRCGKEDDREDSDRPPACRIDEQVERNGDGKRDEHQTFDRSFDRGRAARRLRTHGVDPSDVCRRSHRPTDLPQSS
jgi:hypothetical protein